MTGTLEASGLVRHYRSTGFLRRAADVRAVDDVSFTLSQGQRLGIVGESGSGKSTLLRLVLGLEKPDAGKVSFDGRPVTAGTNLRWYRRQVQFVPQDPSSSLNPHRRVLDAVKEPLECLRVPGDHAARVGDCLAAVGLDPSLGNRYPGELSGGQRQRVAIARALAPEPAVIVADEAVSALDALVRLQVMTTLRQICEEAGVGLLFISHDLGAVNFLCDSVLVLNAGKVAETGPIPRTFEAPTAEQTRALVASVPVQPS